MKYEDFTIQSGRRRCYIKVIDDEITFRLIDGKISLFSVPFSIYLYRSIYYMVSAVDINNPDDLRDVFKFIHDLEPTHSD
jgi:hypothetical protein